MGTKFHDILDAHVHVFGNGVQGVKDMLALEKQYGYTARNFLSCECMDDAAQNALGIFLKAYAPENYAFGGLNYRYEYDFAKELDELWNIGFDGMKMVENKPTLRKQIGIPFNDPRYDEFYASLEKRQITLLSHVGDPEEFWDRKQIPEWAVAAGYFYGDGTFPAKETLYEEVEDVLTRFPGMKVILAHLFFMSADLERLDALMERHPNVSVDIVSGSEMYFNFAKRTEDWRSFFLKYQDRIIYGTDNMNLYDKEERNNADVTNAMQQGYLETAGRVVAWDKYTVGTSLPEEVLKKIYRDNFVRLVKGQPRPLNREAAARYLEKRLANSHLALREEERAVIQEVLEFIS